MQPKTITLTESALKTIQGSFSAFYTAAHAQARVSSKAILCKPALVLPKKIPVTFSEIRVAHR